MHIYLLVKYLGEDVKLKLFSNTEEGGGGGGYLVCMPHLANISDKFQKVPFQTMRSDKNTWLQNVQYILLTNGLGSVWHNPERWEKDQLKHILMQKLQDMFIQQYRAYLNDKANSDKCHLAKMCDKGA